MSEEEKVRARSLGCILRTMVALHREEDHGNPAFDLGHLSDVSVQAYVSRLCKYTELSSGVVPATMVYIDRLLASSWGGSLGPRNVHGVVLAAFVVTCKFFEDDLFTMRFYARVGGASIEDLVRIEANMAKMLHFCLWVSPETLEEYNSILLLHPKSCSSCKTDKI